jgi:hypothetical protein
VADKKISALTAASTPLAGTEVLPIVQSSTTVKVTVDDLTVKNVRSNATTGILQIAGPGVGTTRVMTTPNANFTAARTDAAQSFTGDQTLSTGNLIQGTAAKGFNFTANTPAAGMTSQLLNWYEEGTWTPTISGTSTAGTGTYNAQGGVYTRVGKVVTAQCYINLAAHTGTGNISITGLPFTSSTGVNDYASVTIGYLDNCALAASNYPLAFISPNTTAILLAQSPVGGGALNQVPMDTSFSIMLTATYRTT